MATKNAIRVDRHRKLKGNDTQKEKYHKLRSKYDIDSLQANKMKCWSTDRILDYLAEHKIAPLKTLKEADRLWVLEKRN